MRSGGDDGMVVGRPEPVWDFRRAQRKLQAEVEMLDGQKSWSAAEVTVLNVGLFGADEGFREAYTGQELEAARGYLRWVQKVSAPLLQDDPATPTIEGFSSEGMDQHLSTHVSERGRFLLGRYKPLKDYLFAVAQRKGCSFQGAFVQMDIGNPIPHFVLEKEVVVGANAFFKVGVTQEAGMPLPTMARGLFQFLPPEQFGIPITPQHHFMVELARGTLYVMVYQELPGNKALYVTHAEVPEEIVERYFHDVFCPAIQRKEQEQQGPARPQIPPSMGPLPEGTRGA